MNFNVRLFACALGIAALNACADPIDGQDLEPFESVQEVGLEQPVQGHEGGVSLAETQGPRTEIVEEPDAQDDVAYNPDGLSIGPGSGFIVLNDPVVVPGIRATWLAPDELVLGIAFGDQARAYPISQMAYHHIANDQIDGEPYLVTY